MQDQIEQTGISTSKLAAALAHWPTWQHANFRLINHTENATFFADDAGWEKVCAAGAPLWL